MNILNKCECGHKPMLIVELYNPYPKTYIVECNCGKRTSGCFDADQAIAEWNKMDQIKEVVE